MPTWMATKKSPEASYLLLQDPAQGPRIVLKLGWGSGKFSLKMCNGSGKFSSEICSQCGKLNLKMLPVKTEYVD